MTVIATRGGSREIDIHTARKIRALAADAALVTRLAAPVRRSVHWSRLIAVTVLLVLLGLAALVPLSSGIVATGRVVVEGERKLVQHPAGGVIREILVREGQRVAAGEIVMRIEDPQAEALVKVLSAQIDGLRVDASVREAELADSARVDISADLLARQSDPVLAPTIKSQLDALAARRKRAQARRTELDERLRQNTAEAAAVRARIASRRRQAALLEDELSNLRPLFAKGLITRPRVLALERGASDARGEIESLSEDINRLAAQRDQISTQRARDTLDTHVEATEALRTIRADLASATERLTAAQATLRRTEVMAPVDGVVVALRANTVNGVARAGEPLMEIVPAETAVVVKARIKPGDANDLHGGLPVDIRIDAFARRGLPNLDGTLAVVSADSLVDERTGERYFEAQVRIDAARNSWLAGREIPPGLPADLLIRTGERTALQYLIAPFERAALRAMREL